MRFSELTRSLLLAGALGAVSWPVGLSGQPLAVLNTDTIWRYHYTIRPEATTVAGSARVHQQPVVTNLPPPNWMLPDFDDTDWARATGPFLRGSTGWGYGHGASPQVGLACLRGAFVVTDPMRVGNLLLNAEYRGGIVVHLNGRELARQHLPAGDLSFDTLAEQYPREAYIAPDGGPLESHNVETHAAQLDAQRTRRLTRLSIPAAALRPGVNVLAVQLHPAPATDYGVKIRTAWAKIGLDRIELLAAPGAALTPNVAPPGGLQIWNANPLQEIDARLSHGDPTLPLRPIRMVGPRNATCSGQVVFSSTEPFTIQRAAPGALQTADAAGTIPAAAIRVRFASRHHRDATGEADGHTSRFYNVLSDTPLPPAKLQPVWVTVHVPADAAPGEYTGWLTIQIQGQPPGRMPLRLRVCDWRAPSPREFASHLNLLQSPESVAYRYGVPLWSDRHTALLQRSLDLLGQVGQNVIHLPLVRHTHFGNEETIVRWIPRADRHEPDFSAVEKYFAAFARHVGPPHVVCLYVWDTNMARNETEHRSVPVSVVDPATGAVGEFAAPFYGVAGSESFWKPALDGIRERVRRMGWSEEVIMLGVAADARPGEQVAGFFQQLAPYARWNIFTHSRGDPPPREGRLQLGPLRIGYLEEPWSPRLSPHAAGDGARGGWDQPLLRASAARQHLVGSGLGPSVYRTLMDAHVGGEYRGVARVGADYWPVPRGDRRFGTAIHRYVSWVNLMRNPHFILSPGPDGAEATVSFEMLREGIQETEARIFIERVLADDQRRRKLGDELLERCHAALRDRHHALYGARQLWEYYPASGWQTRAAELFDTAGAVARAIAAPP
jgi:hypothetical protein